MGRLFLKLFMLELLVFFNCLNANGQRRELLVAPIAQLNDTWCWVASMEMILRFHNPSAVGTYSQPNIYNIYSAMRPGWNDTLNCRDCSGNRYTFNAKPSSRCANIFSIPMSTQTYPLKDDYIDHFFHLLKFQSSQEINMDASPIAWPCLKQQIDQCRPFIANVNPTSAEISGNHAIVVKGYLIEGATNYLIANDPWFRCDPFVTTVFPYRNFLNIPGGSRHGTSIEKVLSIVGNIRIDQVYPVENDNCVSCDVVSAAMNTQCFIEDPAPRTMLEGASDRKNGHGGAEIINIQDTIKQDSKGDQLVSLLLDNKDRVAGFKQNILSDESVKNILGQKKYFGSKVKYLSVKKLGKCFIFHKPNTVSETLEHEEEVFDIVSGGVDQNVVSTFQKNKEGLWVLRKITNHTSLKSRIDLNTDSLSPNNKTFVLSNLQGEDSIQGSIPYELIKFPPFQYEFYLFEYNGGRFMSPAEDYSELKFKWGTAYPERKVMGEMRNIANAALNEYRFDLKIDYKEQLSQLGLKTDYGKLSSKSKK